jgi:hypothetical protein
MNVATMLQPRPDRGSPSTAHGALIIPAMPIIGREPWPKGPGVQQSLLVGRTPPAGRTPHSLLHLNRLTFVVGRPWMPGMSRRISLSSRESGSAAWTNGPFEVDALVLNLYRASRLRTAAVGEIHNFPTPRESRDGMNVLLP